MSVHRDSSRTSLQRLLSLALLAVLISPILAHATVLEYGEDGKTSVTEAKKKTQRTVASKPDGSLALRNLTRDVAIKYSGAPGVRKAGLDALTFVDIFAALIERESAFDPAALSPKGAQGLGQLMPATAKDMGVTNPFDPETNLNGSAKYLTLLLAEFGSLDLALAAYNAGPERVKEHKGVPPFAETRAYIDWIFKTASIAKATAEQGNKPVPVNSTVPVRPIHTEQPLTGDISVWEF